MPTDPILAVEMTTEAVRLPPPLPAKLPEAAGSDSLAAGPQSANSPVGSSFSGERSEAVRRLADWLGPYSVSMFVHATVLLMLALWVFPPQPIQQTMHELLVNTYQDPRESADASPADVEQIESVALSGGLAADEDTTDAVEATAVSTPGLRDAGGLLPSEEPPVRTDPGPLSISNLTAGGDGQMRAVVVPRRRRPAAEGVSEVEGVAAAVDGITGGIRAELERDDLLVVWLLDASLSLVDDRQEVAERLEPFFREIEARDRKQSSQLLNAVVAFGASTVPLVAPTRFSKKILHAIRDMPVDDTGLENVMTAVTNVVDRYQKKWRKPVMVVIWTDESGDDTLSLEATIRFCRYRNTTVSVIGPSAVLGSQRGSHLWTHAQTGFRFLLPVNRGPDAPLPERLMLPYWHEGQLPPWSRGGARVAGGPWYGGPHREGLLSGIGPYALTRLALETGGTFTLLDRPGDRGPYRLDKLKGYLPDYDAADEYMRKVQASPLRRAVSGAVLLSDQEVNLFPPSLAFILSRSHWYPYHVVGGYHTPADFRALLRDELTRQQKHALAVSLVIERSLELFTKVGEYDYDREPSPRWKAWYDLTRGRLLAMSVRHREYLLTCEMVRRPGFLAATTNHLVFQPSPEYISGSEIEGRAREAHRLLTRCMKSNPETPWYDLAMWELNHELGLDVQQTSVPPPMPSPPGPPRAPDPVIQLPNL